MLERKSWSNEQYPRRECLQIFGFPSSKEDGQLAGKVLQIFTTFTAYVSTSRL